MTRYLKKSLRFAKATMKERLCPQSPVQMVRLGVNPNSSSLGMSALLLMYGLLAVGLLAPVASAVARVALSGTQRGEVAIKGRDGSEVKTAAEAPAAHENDETPTESP